MPNPGWIYTTRTSTLMTTGKRTLLKCLLITIEAMGEIIHIQRKYHFDFSE